MALGLHHVRTHYHKKSHGLIQSFDKSMYFFALVGPIMTLPQLYDVWTNHQKASVSILTWSAYAVISALWCLYGMIHKEKQLILVNFLMVLLDGLIVAGVLFLR